MRVYTYNPIGPGLLLFVFDKPNKLHTFSHLNFKLSSWQRTSQMENDSVRSSQFNNMHVQEQSYYDTTQTSKTEYIRNYRLAK